MRNSIANGNGDSRYMKSAIPENITHEELVSLLRDGRFPFDFNGINPEGFAQMGHGLTKENLLNDDTETIIWGNAADRTVSQAFYKLAMAIYAGDGMILDISVITDSGEPIPGVLVEGVYDSGANIIYTDAEGKASGFTTSTTATLTISGFYDLEDTTVTVTGDRGSTQNVVITVKRRNFLSVTSTQTRMFSPLCKRVDVTAVGGGGGGANFSGSYSSAYEGYAGGAGGYVSVKEQVDFVPLTDYTATVGSGGNKGTEGSSTNANGKTGGTSSFLGVSAAGGEGGYIGNATRENTKVAKGNGNGGKAGLMESPGAGTDGTQSGFISFTESGLFGGGGGAGIVWAETGTPVPRAGGSPYGGKGAAIRNSTGRLYAHATSPTGPGGGGGGGCYYPDLTVDSEAIVGNPSAGYRGVVNIRMWFEEDLAA